MDRIDLVELREIVIKKITRELNDAYHSGTLDDFLKKYNLEEEVNEEAFYYDSNNAKILVIGDSRISYDDMRAIAKHNGIYPNRIEFVEFEKAKHYNFERLRNNMSYSDILVGPISHKGKGLDDSSSFLAMVRKQPESFPRVIELRDSHELKITKNTFKAGLLKTRMYNEI